MYKFLLKSIISILRLEGNVFIFLYMSHYTHQILYSHWLRCQWEKSPVFGKYAKHLLFAPPDPLFTLLCKLTPAALKKLYTVTT